MRAPSGATSHLDRAGRVDAGTIGSTWGGGGGGGAAPGSMRQAGRGAGRSSGKKTRKSGARASQKGLRFRRPPVSYYYYSLEFRTNYYKS